MTFLFKVLAQKEKDFPKNLWNKEKVFILDGLKKDGFVFVSKEIGGDASDSYSVVPLNKIQDLTNGKVEQGVGAHGEDTIYVDKEKGIAWRYDGVQD